MKEIDLSVQDIKDLLSLVNQNELSSLKIEQGDFKLEIKGKKTPEIITTREAMPLSVASAVEAVAPVATESEPAYTGNLVTSPIVGTFYASPAPDKPVFVQVGSKVKKGDTLFIIESMKLMNEVNSEYSGTVTKILVDDAEGVEYGQPIMTIE